MGRRIHTRPVEGATDVWLTPPEWIDRLGPFDLDPCYSRPRPFATAVRHYGLPEEDGLALPWRDSRVWLNPPFGRQNTLWLEKMAGHGDGIAVNFARTDTKAWHRWVWPFATSILFLEGRPHFHLPDGTRARMNSGGPVVLIAYGERNAESLEGCGIPGKHVRLTGLFPEVSEIFPEG